MSDDYSFTQTTDPGNVDALVNVLQNGPPVPQDPGFMGFQPQPEQYAQAPGATASDASPPKRGALAGYSQFFPQIAGKLNDLRKRPEVMEAIQSDPSLGPMMGTLPQEDITPDMLGSHEAFTGLTPEQMKALMKLYSQFK